MKLTQAYIRKLIMEELLNENEISANQQQLAQQINQSAKTSPFIIMMNRQTSAQDQLFVLQQFLEKITIKNPVTFYKDLSNMALKLKDSNPQTEKPAQPTAQSPVAKGTTK